MSKMYITVGIPASGKSSYYKESRFLMDENTIYISSDETRLELFDDEEYQGNNNMVFEVMNKRAKETLNSGKDVYYDAMNLSRKRRKGLMSQMPKDTEFYAIYFNAPLEEAIHRNKIRKRTVPEYVILNSYKSLDVPIKGEGFLEVYFKSHPTVISSSSTKTIMDVIKYGKDVSHDELFNILGKKFEPFEIMRDMPQDSTYHPFSISRHTYHVYQAMRDSKYGDDIDMLVASLLHDSGKPICKTFYNYKGDLKRYASFYNHERVSAQITFDFYKKFPYFDAVKVSTLCQFHMRLHDPNCKKDELKELIGEEIYDKLVVLNECDKKGK